MFARRISSLVNNQAAEVEGRARRTKPPQLAAEPVVPLRCSSRKADSKVGVGDVSVGCLSGCLSSCLAVWLVCLPGCGL